MDADIKFSIVPEWLIEQAGPRALQLYAVLGRYIDSDREAFPSVASLAERMRCSESTVKRAREELEALGALTVQARFDDAGDRTSNLYVLHVAQVTSDRGGVTSEPTPPVISEPTGGVTSDRVTRTTMNESQWNEKERPSPSVMDPAAGRSEDVVRLTRRFAQLVYANGHPVPAPGTAANRKWYDVFDLLLRIGPVGDDGSRAPDAETVEAVMEWALVESDFWPANIRSAAKFRHQWSRLVAQARQQMRPTSKNPTGLDAVLAYIHGDDR